MPDLAGWRERAESWTFVSLAKATFEDFAEDKAARLGAALAYYTIFSIAPLLVITLAIAGLAFGAEAAGGQLFGAFAGLVGPEGAEAIETMVANAWRPEAGIVSIVLGAAALLFGATGVFYQLKDALNTIWEVRPKKGKGLLRFVKARILSFGMVLALGFLLVSLVVTAAVSAVGEFVRASLPGGEGVFLALNFLVGTLIVAVCFAALFKWLPDARIAWRDVGLGALVTAVLFNVGQLAIGLYLGRSSAASVYGAAGSLVLVLLWIFYSAQLFFLGAEFTQVYANRSGSRVTPEPGAVRVTEEERSQQGMPDPAVTRGGRSGRREA